MILSTSEKIRKPAGIGRKYLVITAVCAVISAVYEYFSFGVYSVSMICLCLYPFFLGALPFAFLKAHAKIPYPSLSSLNLWNAGVATLTAGSLVRGIVEIYGTTTPFLVFYDMAGIVFLAAGLGLWICSLLRQDGAGSGSKV